MFKARMLWRSDPRSSEHPQQEYIPLHPLAVFRILVPSIVPRITAILSDHMEYLECHSISSQPDDLTGGEGPYSPVPKRRRTMPQLGSE